MCFSAYANFIATAAIGSIRVATLRHVRHPKGTLFALTPLLFALHQFAEGFVWLGLDHRIGIIAFNHAVFLFILYAQGILPFLMPLAVLLMEPPGWRWRKQVIAGFTMIGAVLCIWISYAIMALPSLAIEEHNSIAYRNSETDSGLVGIAYILATCGALIFLTHTVIRWFGILNIVGLTIVLLVKGYAFISIWCAYAAVLSILIYWQYRGRHINIDRPNVVIN